jgi:hypothetical protein
MLAEQAPTSSASQYNATAALQRSRRAAQA